MKLIFIRIKIDLIQNFVSYYITRFIKLSKRVKFII